MIDPENSKSTNGKTSHLNIQKENYEVLFESLHQNFCIIQMLFDETEGPVDYRFLKVNSSFKEEAGAREVEGKKIREIAPHLEKYWIDVFAKVALTGEPTHFEHKSETQKDQWYEVFAYRFGQAENRQVAILFRDISERKKTEVTQRNSEERLKIAIDTGKFGSWELDLSNNTLISSDSCKANFGLSPNEELSHERLAEMIHPEDREGWQKAVEQAIQKQQDFKSQYRIYGLDGKVNWILAQGRAFYTADGVPDKMIGVTQNITEQKQDEEKLIKLKNKLDADLLVMTHLHELSLRLTSSTDFQPMLEEILEAAIELQKADFGTLQLYNDETGALELYVQQGFEADFERFYSSVKGSDTACGRTVKEGRRVIVEDVNTDPRYEKNREKALEFGYQAVQATPLFDRAGNIIGVLSTHFKKPHRPSKRILRFTDLYARQAADMIDLKLAEEKLRASEEKLKSVNETLEKRVEERTSALLSYQNQLRLLASQLSKAEDQERQRLATELHDNLGQMLAVCKMKIELLEKEGQESEIAEASELVDEAIRYTRELMSSLKPPPSLNDENLTTAVEWVAAKMEKHDLKVRVDDDGQPKSLSKEVRTTVLRAVRELLFNVIKHAGVNEARINLSRKEGRVYISVEDNGKGFDIKKQKSTESLNGGFGLFNISERMDLLEGSLNIESKPGKGTKAILIAPLANNEGVLREESGVFEGKQLEAVFRKEGSPIIKVLLADDHQVMREGLRRIIDGEKDLTIIGEASNGKEAVEKARELAPDVIVMDINMPEMNGILATKEIKSELPHINIIGLSFHDDGEVAREMRNVGASAYLTKSDAFETLCATIRSEAVAVKD